MKYVPLDGNTPEVLVLAVEGLLDVLDKLPLERVTIRHPDGYVLDKGSVLQAARTLRAVAHNFERQQIFGPRSSTEEQASSIRKVGGSNPSEGSA